MKITRHNLPQAFKKGEPSWNKGTKGVMKSNKTSFKKGSPPWNKGKKSPWTSERNKVQNRERAGDKHWHWKGGVSTERHRLMGQLEYKQWRTQIFERDNWTCQNCQKRGSKLEAHHIKSWSEFPALRFEVENGVTLCELCHIEIDSYRKRFSK